MMAIINLTHRAQTKEDYFSTAEEVLLAITSTPERLVRFMFYLSILSMDEMEQDRNPQSLKNAAEYLCETHGEWMHEMQAELVETT